jgi:methionyl-tRNA formyltransferase
MLFRRVQQRLSRLRIQAICRQFGLEPHIPASLTVMRVSSVNAPECVEALRRLAPAVVLVNGTRVIAREVLRSVPVPFINCHTGITPKYRGVYGGYWALAEGDRENCGSTVHLIDEGIDTGGILYQARIEPAPEDNFSTYPYLQLAVGLPLLADAAEDAMAGRLSPHDSDLPSRLRVHPTLWGYLATGWRRGVW